MLNAVMIYAPRNEAEIDIVLEVTRAALNYASTPTTPTKTHSGRKETP